MENQKTKAAGNIFQFKELEDFLSHFAENMKATNPHWSIGSWAKHLGQPSTASLSRVLNKQRSPSLSLVESLDKYFGFTEIQKEYYLFLILKSKANADPLLAQLMSKKFWHGVVPSDQKAKPFRNTDNRPLLEIERGRLTSLTCLGDLQKINEHLAAEGLEAINFNGKARLALNFCNYIETNVGPYGEFYISIFVKRFEDSLSDVGLVFKQLYSNQEGLINLGRVIWGNNYYHANLEHIDYGGTLYDVSGKPMIKMIPSRNLEWATGVTEFTLYGYSHVTGSRTKSKISASFQSYESTVTSNCTFEIFSPELKTYCDSLGLLPLQWSRFEDLKSCSWAPEL